MDMGFITGGLFSIVVGMMLLDVRDTPTTWHPWDVVSLLLMIAGVVAVLVGMWVQVVAVNRGDR
jgi:hypothetical protein